MDSSSSNFSSFDPLTSLSSFPTYIIYPFDQLSSPQQSLGSVSPDPLFSSLNFDSFEASDFNNSLGNSLSGYSSSLLNFTNSPPSNDVLTSQNKSPLSPYLYEPHNLTSMSTHTGMTFQSILDAIQGNLTTDSNNPKLNPTVFTSTFNTTPIPSVYTLLKINEKESSDIPANKNLNKTFSTVQTVNIFNDTNNLMEDSIQQQFHAYSKFTLLKKKPTKHHRKESLTLSCPDSTVSNVDNLSKELICKIKVLKSKKASVKNDKKILANDCHNTFIKTTSLVECDVVKVKNMQLRPAVEIKEEQLIKIDGKNRWKCDICDKSYTKKHNLVTHMFGHDGIKPFSCSTCGRCFKQLSHLNTHTLTHSTIKKYQCEVCKHSFVQSSHLRRHMKLHSRKSFSCTVCKKEFTEFKDLHQHYAFEICTRIAIAKTKLGRPSKFACGDCDKSFLHMSHLRVHSNIHSNVRQFICTECGQEFNREHHLKYHTLTHSGIQPFSCAICSRKFSQKSNLIRHKLTHSAEKRYKCSICQQSFKHQQALNVHCVKHRPILPFKCQHCNKSFTRRHSLKAHINLHKDTKQHACMCGAAFTLKCNLNRHQRDKNCRKVLKNNLKAALLDIDSNHDILVTDGDQAHFVIVGEGDQNHDVVDQINKLTPKKKRKSMPRKTVTHEPEANEGDEDVTEAWKVVDKTQQITNQPKKISSTESKLVVHFNFNEILPEASSAISAVVPIASEEIISTQSVENDSNLIILTKLQPL